MYTISFHSGFYRTPPERILAKLPVAPQPASAGICATGSCFFKKEPFLHFFRGLEAQNGDAGLQNILGKTDKGDVARLLFLVLLAQNAGLVIELVHAPGQLVDIGADQVGGGGPQGAFQGGGQTGDGEHQVLGTVVDGGLNGQMLPSAVLGQDGLHPDDGVEDIGAGVALEGGEPL